MKALSKAALVAATLFLGTLPTTAQCLYTSDGSGVLQKTLYAGQTLYAGTVTYQIVGSNLEVTYTATGGYELTDAHLWVGTDMANMPQTRKGNPKIGNYPYSSGDITGATSYTFSVDLSTVTDYTCPSGENGDIFAAAHAALRIPDGSGGYDSETGWSDGDRFVERGSWGTFTTVTLTCDCGTSNPDPDTDCETAFAVDVDGSGNVVGTCFLDIDEDGDGAKDPNRWGWTNLVSQGTTVTWPIYAGAGQCDLNKGTVAGSLTVDYQLDGTVVVDYAMLPGVTMSETHLYVGTEILPRDNQNDFTVAPGQYPYTHDDTTGTWTVGATSDQYVLPNQFSGDIYVVAHAVVCGVGTGTGGPNQPCDVDVVDLGAVKTALAAAAGPDGIMEMTVQFPGGDSYFDLDLTGNVDGMGDDGDGSLELVGADGWCIDTSRDIQNETYCVTVTSSYDDQTVLANLVDKPENLHLVNWIINQDFTNQQTLKVFGDAYGTLGPPDYLVDCNAEGAARNYTWNEIQRAIWVLVDDNPLDFGLGNSWNTCAADEIVNAALISGYDGTNEFIPGCDEQVAVILRPVPCPDQTDPTEHQITIAQITLTQIPQSCTTIPCPPKPPSGPCVTTGDGSGVQCQTLYAGQTTDAGSVCVEVVGDDLVITYTTTGGWELVETHTWIGDDIAPLPQTPTGNPKIGNFPYQSGDITGTTGYAVVLPLANLLFDCVNGADTYLIAAHAALRRPDGMGGYDTETGWADGDRFVEQGAWGTFFNIELSCVCGTPNPTDDCETAFAYGGTGIGECFIGLDANGDGNDEGINRWGWTNSLMPDEVQTWEIYAGAGQCDTSKGTLVGLLTADYSVPGEVTVSYDMTPSSPYTISEYHLYVGSEMLPTDTGGFTVAPGQYPVVIEDRDSTSETFTVTGLSGNVWVVAHAVVCGFPAN